LAIPLWNKTLTPLKSHPDVSQRIAFKSCEYDPDPENFPEEEQPQQLPNETEDDFYWRWDDWVRDTRRVVRPEPGQFELPGVKQGGLGTDGTESSNEKRVDLKREFGDRGLQIIVKLSSIHLTPENPSYGGGTWHVEGQLVRVHQISFLAAAHHLFPI
jgi:hypothetical protein